MQNLDLPNIPTTVANHMRSLIISGQLSSGQKLNEVQLSKRLGISRPTLRAAFQILENECLVASTPRKGTNVKKLSIEDLRELYDAREMIECYAIDLIESKQIKDLSALDRSLGEASLLTVPKGDNVDDRLHYLDVTSDFHIRLVHVTGNQRICQFYRTIASNLKQYQFMHLTIPGMGGRSLEYHQEIFSLLKKGAYSSAKKTLVRHFNNTLKDLERLLLS